MSFWHRPWWCAMSLGKVKHGELWNSQIWCSWDSVAKMHLIMVFRKTPCGSTGKANGRELSGRKNNHHLNDHDQFQSTTWSYWWWDFVAFRCQLQYLVQHGWPSNWASASSPAPLSPVRCWCWSSRYGEWYMLRTSMGKKATRVLRVFDQGDGWFLTYPSRRLIRCKDAFNMLVLLVKHGWYSLSMCK